MATTHCPVCGAEWKVARVDRGTNGDVVVSIVAPCKCFNPPGTGLSIGWSPADASDTPVRPSDTQHY